MPLEKKKHASMRSTYKTKPDLKCECKKKIFKYEKNLQKA